MNYKVFLLTEKLEKKLDLLGKAAVSVGFAVAMGRQVVHKFALETPEASLGIASGDPNDPKTRFSIFEPTQKEASDLFDENPYLHNELYLSEVVQTWFDYLADLYRVAVEEMITGKKKRPIPPVQLRVQFGFGRKSAVSHLLEAAVNAFEFASADEKLSLVKRVFGFDFKVIDRELRSIRTNIVVRNILQHNSGVIRQEDLDRLGAKYIVVNTAHDRRGAVVGQRIIRTEYDMEELISSVARVSCHFLGLNPDDWSQFQYEHGKGKALKDMGDLLEKLEKLAADSESKLEENAKDAAT